jgi:hypothetical protein
MSTATQDQEIARQVDELVDECRSAGNRRSLLTERYSACNEAARRAQQERIWAMTPYERMALAFALGRRRRALQARFGPRRAP